MLLLLLSSNHRHPAPKDVLALAAAAAACGFKVLFLTEQAISRVSFLDGSPRDLWHFLGLRTRDLWDSKGPHGGNATTFLMGAFVGSPRNEAGKLTRAKQEGGSTNGLTDRSVGHCANLELQDYEYTRGRKLSCQRRRKRRCCCCQLDKINVFPVWEDAMRRKQTVCRWIGGCVQGGQS